MCEDCGTEADVEVPAHAGMCSKGAVAAASVKPAKGEKGEKVKGSKSMTRVNGRLESVHERDASGALTQGEINRRDRAKDALMEMTVRCGVDGCVWPGFTGTAEKAQAAAQAHRLAVHPGMASSSGKEKRRAALAAARALERQTDILAALDAGESVRDIPTDEKIDEPEAEPVTVEPELLPAPVSLDVTPVRAPKKRHGRHMAYTREEIAQEIRQWAADRNGEGPRQADWERAGDDHPAASTVLRIFGTFDEALKEACVTPRPKVARKPKRMWPNERILEAIVAFNEEHGRPPYAREWRDRSDEHPTDATVRKFFGTWNDAVAAAGLAPLPRGVVGTRAAMAAARIDELAGRVDGLTAEEGIVMDHLVAAAEAFGALDRQHPSETPDFTDAIHTCQYLLAVRIVRRLHPAGWPVKR